MAVAKRGGVLNTISAHIRLLFFEKKSWLILVIMLTVFGYGGAYAQDRIELGVFGGASYYFGDLNPGTQFQQSHPAFGGIGRYVFNDRLALKGMALIGRISGDYPKSDLVYLEQPDAGTKYGFNKRIGDLSAQLEVNFMSYDHKYITNTTFTPYLTFGLATTVYHRSASVSDNSAGKSVFILSLPFGFGAKYKVSRWVRVGAEWTFRKTFVDDLDGGGGNFIDPTDPYGFNESTFTHNNDWYSFAGVYVTVSLFRRRSSCNGGY